MAANPASHPLVRKLESIAALTPEETQALLDLPLKVDTLRADQDIVRDGDRPSRCCVLLEGVACRFKITEGGRRQIMSFHVAGDIPDLQSLHLKVMDHSLGTLTACKVGFVNHEDLRALCLQHPRLAGVLWRDTLIDAAIFRQWMIGLGRKEAYGRIAHFLCEWFLKLKAVGLTDGATFPLPMSQAELADALGLTTVHINRTLMKLRDDGLIALRGGRGDIRDWDGLTRAGEFDPTYLHMDPRLAA